LGILHKQIAPYDTFMGIGVHYTRRNSVESTGNPFGLKFLKKGVSKGGKKLGKLKKPAIERDLM